VDRLKALEGSPELIKLFDDFKNLYQKLDESFMQEFNRSLPISELLNDRWERAARLGFGKGSSIYDSSLVFGHPKVGENCWIGPYTIIDGSGGLKIGNSCTISTGVHIYTHDNLKATLKPAAAQIEHLPVRIGNNCYIAPNSLVAKGVNLGDFCVVAANSMVNKTFDSNSIVGGNPAKLLGKVEFIGDSILFNYNKDK
jgi:acetyltransferase-like isoleucine patch superfamily enzyme